MTGRLGSAASAAGFDWVAYTDPSFIYAAVRCGNCDIILTHHQWSIGGGGGGGVGVRYEVRVGGGGG